MFGVLAFLLAVVAVALGAIAAAATKFLPSIAGALVGLRQVMQESYRVDEKGLEARFRDLEDLVDRLPQRWEEIKRETSRLDARARYSVSRARQELADRGLADERLDELGAELRLIDGDGGEDEGVHAVRGEVEGVPAQTPGQPAPPDWQTLARMRKFGG